MRKLLQPRLRQAGRWAILLAALALAWPWGGSSAAAVVLPALSPFVAVGSLLAVRAGSALPLLAVPVAWLAILFPRWFCRHGCPTGLAQDLARRFRPGARAGGRGLRALGPGVVLLTWAGACLGYPLVLWLDPLALFQGFLNAWRAPLSLAALLAGLGLPALLALELARPRLWCRRLCPLGATQDLLAWPRRLWRRHAAGQSQAAGARRPAAGWALARRAFLAAGAGVAGALVVRTTRAGGVPPLRPPGALDAARFAGVCVRCGNCARACPAHIIRPDLGASGLFGLLTPRLCFEEDYCREDCHRCTRVCPSGALARLDLAAKRRAILGRAEVALASCLLANGRECTACIRACPYEALTLQTTQAGFATRPRVEPDKCTGCGACEAVCPVRPHRAIRVVVAMSLPPRPQSDSTESFQPKAAPGRSLGGHRAAPSACNPGRPAGVFRA